MRVEQTHLSRSLWFVLGSQHCGFWVLKYEDSLKTQCTKNLKPLCHVWRISLEVRVHKWKLFYYLVRNTYTYFPLPLFCSIIFIWCKNWSPRVFPFWHLDELHISSERGGKNISSPGAALKQRYLSFELSVISLFVQAAAPNIALKKKFLR